MDLSTIYTKTGRGARALIKKLPSNAGQILSVMGGTANADEIYSRLKKINEKDFDIAITWLLEGGFIRIITKEPFSDSIWAPVTQSSFQLAEISIDEFNDTVKAAADALSKVKEDTKAKLEALDKADAEARERAETQAKAEAAAQREAEAKAKENAEAEAKIKAEIEAKEQAAAEAKAKLEALERADAEARERAEALAKAEAAAQGEAEAKAKENAEAEAKIKAKIEAQELAATEAKAKLEAEELAAAEEKEQADAEAEIKAKIEAKEQATAEEQARLEASARAEAAAAAESEAKKQAEIKAQMKAEMKAAAQAQRKQMISGAKLQLQNLLRSFNLNKVKKTSGSLLSSILALSKTLLMYAFVVLVLLIAAAQFINLRMLIKPIEKIASENLAEAVNIQAIHASLFPAPHLIVNGITVGDSSELKIQSVRMFPVFSSLINGLQKSTPSQTPYQIDYIEVEGLSLAQQDLPHPALWLNAVNQHQQLKVNKILLKKMMIQLNGMELPELNGDILLSADGQLSNAALITEDKSLAFNIKHSADDFLIQIKAVNWRAPMSPNPVFNELTANGVIKNQRLTLSQIEGVLYEGALKANLIVDMTADWAIQGDLELKSLDLTDMALALKLNSAVDGTLSTDANFSFSIDSTTNQIATPSINARFKVNNGYLRKVDLIEAMHSNARNAPVGGSTHFTELTGNLLLNAQSYQFRNLVLQDKQLLAVGKLDISAQKIISGDIHSKIILPSQSIKSHLIISGSFDNLKLKK